MSGESTLNILYFAWVRERIGRDAEVIPHPGADCTVAELVDRLATTSDAHAAAFTDRERLRAALDQVFVPFDTPIGSGRELALFPPVTGG